MEFTFETIYNQEAVTAMAKALRQTVRKKHSRRSHIWGWIIIVVAVLLTLPLGEEKFVVDFKTIITWIATVAILIVLLFEDQINGYVARKRMLAGTDRATSVFNEEGYSSISDMGKTEWHYANIQLLAETGRYFVFIFDKSHAQVYDKNNISGGTPDEFRSFISEKTSKEVERIK